MSSISGGLGGMHAQAALARWARDRAVARCRSAAPGSRPERTGPDGRRHVIETLGLVPDDRVLLDLASVAVDRSEADIVRMAAIAAFGDRVRAPMPPSISALARGDDRVADAVRLTMVRSRQRSVGSTGIGRRSGPDRRLRSEAACVSHRSTSARSSIPTSCTPAWATPAASPRCWSDSAWRSTAPPASPRSSRSAEAPHGMSSTLPASPIGGPQFAPVALDPEAGTAFGDPWPARIVAERGIERVVRDHGRPDVIHLRMADAGTLAAANVAARLGIPTVFSLAPDPHGLIASREASGDLDRRSFGTEDAILHLWYRVHLVERLARQADQVALFPRERLIDQLRELVGIDVTAWPGRFTVVPEGIDVAQIRDAVAARAGCRPPSDPEPRARATSAPTKRPTRR